MQNTFTTRLERRPAHSQLEQEQIHIGDVVHLKPANGPTIRAEVIFNAPINGTVTYTTEVVRYGATAQASKGERIRFRHEHVHRIEPLRRSKEVQAGQHA